MWQGAAYVPPCHLWFGADHGKDWRSASQNRLNANPVMRSVDLPRGARFAFSVITADIVAFNL